MTPLGFIKPELPTLVLEPPTAEGWIHEIKYDGYRTLIVIDRGQVRAFTRNGYDWTTAYRRVVEGCGKLACKAAVIDGEMVVQDEHGLTDFNALRSAIYTLAIQWRPRATPRLATTSKPTDEQCFHHWVPSHAAPGIDRGKVPVPRRF